LQIQHGAPRAGVYQEFVTPEGAVVHVLGAPAGAPLTFTNLATGAALLLQPQAAVAFISLNPDDLRSEVITGHTVLIITPRYAPAQPTTTLFAGSVIFDAAIDDTFTVWGTRGEATDICAALGG
jgi:hypothetical protein